MRQVSDAVAGALRRLARRPTREEGEVPRAGGATAHAAVLEAEEVKALASFAQVHDPRLGLLGSQPKRSQDDPQRVERVTSIVLAVAHHDEIVGVADQRAAPASPPGPVEPVQVDVGEQRRDDPALRRPGVAAHDRALPHHPSTQHRAQQSQEFAIDGPFLDRRHQPVVGNLLKTRGDVRLDDPPLAPPALIDEHLQGIVRRAPRAKAKRARIKGRPRRSAQRRSSQPPARCDREPRESTTAAARRCPASG